MMATMGNISAATVVGLMALLASVAAPIIWVGDIKQVNAVQDNKIETLQLNYDALRKDNRTLGDKIDVLLLRSGVDPLNIK